MILDDGILKIYKIISKKTSMGKVEKVLKYYDEAWYGINNTSISEYYKAKQADVNIEMRIEILQNKGVKSNDVIIIDGAQYTVGRVYHGVDEDDIPIKDITLEKVVNNYEFEGIL